jgi:hypothetical protein
LPFAGALKMPVVEAGIRLSDGFGTPLKSRMRFCW